MSEITRGVMGMPYEMAMGSDISRRQFYAIAREVYAQNGRLSSGVESDMAEIDRIQAAYDDQFRKCRELKAENESLRKDARLLNILVEAMAEVKATSDGESDQPIADIVSGCLAEIAAISSPENPS